MNSNSHISNLIIHISLIIFFKKIIWVRIQIRSFSRHLTNRYVFSFFFFFLWGVCVMYLLKLVYSAECSTFLLCWTTSMCGDLPCSSDPCGTWIRLKFTFGLFAQDKVIGGDVFLHQEVHNVCLWVMKCHWSLLRFIIVWLQDGHTLILQFLHVLVGMRL